MKRRWVAALVCALSAVFAALAGVEVVEARKGAPDIPTVSVEDLPQGVRDTLALLKQGGPFPYKRDGVVFDNRERSLPSRPRGYYREYTVPTPGARDRGARRIVSGGDPPVVYYYTDDHFRSFRQLEPRP